MADRPVPQAVNTLPGSVAESRTTETIGKTSCESNFTMRDRHTYSWEHKHLSFSLCGGQRPSAPTKSLYETVDSFVPCSCVLFRTFICMKIEDADFRSWCDIVRVFVLCITFAFREWGSLLASCKATKKL